MDVENKEVREVFEEATGRRAQRVEAFDNFTTNRVFRVETEERAYIFKAYASVDWPENGKLRFVSRKLGEYGIPHAELFAFCREDARFPRGFLIEQCLPGTTADRLNLSEAETGALFGRLARLTARVHEVRTENFGYIGTGRAEWTRFSEFVEDNCDECSGKLIARGRISEGELAELKSGLAEKLRFCDALPAVLCHGDLSLKNVLVGEGGDLALIDWDDAYSLCWMADLARLTLWMRLHYAEDEAARYRDAFLSRYRGGDIGAFERAEDALHVWYGLDFLNYYVETPAYEKVEPLFEAARKKSGI